MSDIYHTQERKEAFKKLEDLFSKYKKVSLPEKSIFIRPTHKHEFLYFVGSGMVRLFCINDKGEEISIYLFGRSALLPLMSVVSESECSYYVETVEPSVMYKAPVAEVLEFIKKDPAILYLLLEQFGSGLSQMLDRTERSLSSDAYGKIIAILRFLAHKYGQRDNMDIRIKLPLTHAGLATWVGLQRETVSRQLEKMVSAGTISYRKKEFTLHMDRLLTSI